MRDIIINFQKFNTWKIQLAIAIKSISFKDVDEDYMVHSKSDNREFMSYDNAKEVVDELFESFLSRYEISLETLIRGNNFIFYSVELLH